MKKPQPQILLMFFTFIFAALLVGFFVGRNFNRTPVLLRELSAYNTTEETALQTGTVAPTQPEILNINTATAEQLESLPGIGAELAQRIVEYREANGPFASVGALANVSGIGEKKLEAIWDMVTIGGVS